MTQQPQFWVYIPRERKVTLKRLLHPHVHCSIIQNSQEIDNPVSISGWMKKIWEKIEREREQKGSKSRERRRKSGNVGQRMQT